MATRTYEPGEIVRVPFPHTDSATRQRRPALVLTDGGLGRDASLLWVLMITAAENGWWAGDVEIGEPQRQTRLPIPSIVRTTKVATVEAADVDPIGRASLSTLAAVRDAVRRHLGLT